VLTTCPANLILLELIPTRINWLCFFVERKALCCFIDIKAVGAQSCS
jgi:hypothetical protein